MSADLNLLKKYDYRPDDAGISYNIQTIVSNLENLKSNEILRNCFSLMDLTSLHPNDTSDSVSKLVGKVNGLRDAYPGFPVPASVCVFPNFASVVKECRSSEELHVTVVAACFPASQSFLELKIRECVMAVEAGADEVDIVLALNHFCAGDYDAASGEIAEIRSAIDAAAAAQGRKVLLKVILETGVLRSSESIAAASFLAMEAGADFIKTSTGKVDVNATPSAAYVMCECIRKFYELTGRKVGFKAAGGISTAKDALCYYFVVSSVLGTEWLNKDLFRFGVSRLGNALISEVEAKTIKYF